MKRLRHLICFAAQASLVSVAPSALAQYGYGPDLSPASPTSAVTAPVIEGGAPAPTLAQQAGLFHVRDGLFLQLEGTTFSLNDIDGALGSAGSALTADTTYGLMGTIGSIGRHGLGLELAGGYYKTTYSGSFADSGGLSADVDSDITLIPAFVNLRFQLGLTKSLAIEVAAGGGGAYASASATASTDFGDFSAEESAWSAGYQGMLGLTYALGSHADLTLHYRRMKFMTDDLTASSVGLGLRLRF